jgi:hypothetical protein
MRPCRRKSLLQFTVKHAIVVFLRDPLFAFIRLSLFECRQNSQRPFPIRIIGVVPTSCPWTNRDIAGMNACQAGDWFSARGNNHVLGRGLAQKFRCFILQFSNLRGFHEWLPSWLHDNIAAFTNSHIFATSRKKPFSSAYGTAPSSPAKLPSSAINFAA